MADSAVVVMRFGYEPDGVKARPEQADAIRSAVESLLSGVSLRPIARDWNGVRFTNIIRRQ
jgi:hypothetical protein